MTIKGEIKSIYSEVGNYTLVKENHYLEFRNKKVDRYNNSGWKIQFSVQTKHMTEVAEIIDKAIQKNPDIFHTCKFIDPNQPRSNKQLKLGKGIVLYYQK